MRRIIVLFIILCSFSNFIYPAVINGHVIDATTGESLAGATIYIKELKRGTLTASDGTYILKNVPKGSYLVTCRNISYEKIERKLGVGDKDILNFNFMLNPRIEQIDEVNITAHTDRSSDISARISEKDALQVINVLSAKTIESLPDLNVANVMQRVSGVSMVKNGSGNNTEVIVRGMPPRYNSVLVNGTTAPSTSGSTRSVPLDIIPSNLVGRVEVTKALTPDQEANGLGGTVNVEMKDAPDQPLFSLDIASGYNLFFFDHQMATFNSGAVNMKDPAAIHGSDYLANLSDFTRSNMVITKKQPGPDLNGSFSYGQRFFKRKLGVLVSGTAASFNEGSISNYYGFDPTNTNSINYTSKNQRPYYVHAIRSGSNVKLDYQIDQKNRISLHTSLFRLKEDRARNEADTTSEVNWGRIVKNDVTNLDISSLMSFNLKGHHQIIKNLNIDWSLIYSIATSQSPDLVTVHYVQIVHPTVQPFYLNYTGCVTRVWQHNTDEDKTAYLNVKYSPVIFAHTFELKAGGMGRMKFRNNYANEYTFDAPLDNPPNPDIRTVEVTQNRNAQQRNGNPINNPGNYKATEDIQSGYVQVKTSFGKLQVLTGARIEFTYQTNYHSETQNVLVPFTHNRFSYYDVLPSFHLNYQFTDKRNLRFSVYQGISRPNYTELVDFYAQGVNGGSQGNPHLNHSRGTCFDARYEVYPNPEEVLTAGVFYKKIDKPIVDVLSNNNNTSPINLTQPCTNYGFELVEIKYFGKIGFNVNYTYTKSEMKYPGKIYYPTPDVVTKRTEIIPLVGQSPHIVNAAIIYRDNDRGLKCQLVYTMQGKNLKNIYPYYGLDTYQKAYHDLGATIEKSVVKKIMIYSKINNLLDSQVEYYTKSGIKVRDISTSMSFLVGLKYNL